MTQNAITHIDLDEVVQPSVVVRYKGVEHTLKPASVDSYIEMTREVAKVGLTGAGMAEEMELLKKLVGTAFPTLKDELGELTVPQLTKILEIANQANAKEVVGAAGAENPPKAGE